MFMKQNSKLLTMLLLLFLAFSFQTSFAQVTLTATSGTATASFTTLKGAFDAINLGTHKGTIVIKINANTTETASASLTASAALATSSPYYTGITIYPTVTGLSISGSLAAPLINLNGADNVTIDGRVNATGSSKDLTITNTSALDTAGTSTIRFIADATLNTVQYCNLKGSSTNATAGGIVFFSTATTTGNDNNIITNNNITCAADASRPLNAIYALGTSAKNNENNTISNNNIYNFLSRATASQGINISSYNTAYTISDNSFYETASFTASAAVAYNVILISAATGAGNDFTVSGNYIGGSAASCTGTAWTKTALNNAFTAISVTTATGTANEIQGNTIQNFNWTNAGTSYFMGISIAGATVANIGTSTVNTIGAATGTGSITFTSTTTATDFYAINIASTGVVDCQNNTIGSIKVDNASTNATNFYGIFKSDTAGTTTISNNTIGSTTTPNSINASSASSTAANIQSVYAIKSAGTGVITLSSNTIANMVNATSNATVGSAGLISGIYVSAGTNTILNNEVHDLTIANANNLTTSTAAVTGIVMASTTAAAQTVSGNTIYNLSNSFATFAGAVIGIYYSGSTTASAVKTNFIYNLSVSGASSTTADLYGIKIAKGMTTYSNNIISLGGDTKTDLYGIYQTGAASNHNSLYYNTIYIAGSLVSGATNTSYALYSTATTNTRDFRNNIFVNARSTVSEASKHYALYIAASGGTITCNYNNYYVSGTGGVLGYFGADKSALPIVTVTSNDANSIVTNPTFSNAGGTTAAHYIPTVSGVAVTGTGITVDYTGTTRGGTNVTMGAFELKLGPNAPTDVVATANISSASIAFTEPTNIGGDAITNYAYSLDNGSTWITCSPPQTISPLKITGLTNCTDYLVKIRAENVTFAGTASSAVTVTPQNGQAIGTTWTMRTSDVAYNWRSITYGNGLFVAVGVVNSGTSATGNRVMTSPDGITWTTRTSADSDWRSVTFGNGLFVAVSYYTANPIKVMTSPDGINWTPRTAPNSAWYSVTYGNGLFVAVAYSGTNRVMTSPNGFTWTARTAASTNSWRSVTFGNGIFVAVNSSGEGNRVMTSPDGITWTSRTTPVDNNWYSVTYGNGVFVAVSGDGVGNQVMTSPDGTTWTIRASAADSSWTNVTYGNGLFVALASSGTDLIMTSPDGITWTTRTAPVGTWSSVTYGNGLFVAVSASYSTISIGDKVMISSDAYAPGVTTINSITPSVTSASVAFTAPASSGFSTITNYEYSIDNGSTWVTPSPAVTVSPLTISGLTSSTSYPIQLRAVNSAGSSCASATISTTTLSPAPAAPTASAQTFCGSKTVADLVATGSNLKWYDVATNGTALASTTPLATGTYYVSQTVSGSESERTTVLVTITSTNTWTGATSTAWNTASNWSCGVVPDVSSDVIIAAATFAPIISSSEAINTLTLNSSTSLTVTTGYNLTVTNYIHNSGTLTMQNNTNLLQLDASAENTGNIIVKRQSAKIVRLDHTLWSSPVTGQNLRLFSPNTIPYRFYTYDTTNNQYDATTITDATVFTPAKGFAIRAPNNYQAVYPTSPAVEWTGTFTGVPNNGTKTFPLVYASGAANINLVGNPYPSAISATTFCSVNSGVITGTLYFYQHTLTMNSSGLFGAGTNYATWTPAAGGTGVAATSGYTPSIAVAPSGIIEVGQGFMVKSTSTGNVTFNNDMRVASATHQFMKSSSTVTTLEKHRMWLNLESATGSDLNQILVGYVTGATEGVDDGYDGLAFGGTGSSLYSPIDSRNYVIQCRSLPFNNTDEVPLGFNCTEAGTYSIKLSSVDGLFEGNQDVFIRDNLNGTDTNIKVAPFTFTSAVGTFDNRFKIVYTQALGVPSSTFNENSVIVYKNTDWFHVSTKGISMKDILVYDISGRLIFKLNDINDTTAVLKGLTTTKQVLFLKITSTENQSVTIKVLN